MESTTAKLRFLRLAPRKIRLVVDLIRGKKVSSAIEQLEHAQKNAAVPLLKLLRSAVANAKHNHQMKEETLVVEKIFVDEGPTLHRWMPRAFGRASAIRKRTSHITIVLSGESDKKKKDKKADKTVETEKDPLKVEKTDKQEVKPGLVGKIKEKRFIKSAKPSKYAGAGVKTAARVQNKTGAK